MNLRRYLPIILTFTVLGISLLGTSPVHGTVDGTISPDDFQGRLHYVGQITNDVTDFDNGLYTIAYGDSETYAMPFSERTNEFYTYGETAEGYGNITAYPSKTTHGYYNLSGYLDSSDWTLTDAGSIVTWTNNTYTSDVTNAPRCMRLKFASATKSNATASLTTTIDVPVGTSYYGLIGFKIISETTNITTAKHDLYVAFGDSDDEFVGVALQEDSTDLATTVVASGGSYNEILEFDGDNNDEIVYCQTIANMDAWKSNYDIGSITQIKIGFNPFSSLNWAGELIVDIFALALIENVAKVGLDRGDQTSTADDYVALNVTNPSSPTFAVRSNDVNAQISRIQDAVIDFVYEIDPEPYTEASFDPNSTQLTKTYNAKITITTDPLAEVTFSNLYLYYTLEGSPSTSSLTGTKIYSFQIDGVEELDEISGEEAGDVYEVESSVTVTTNMAIKRLVVTRDGTIAEGIAIRGTSYRLGQSISIFGLFSLPIWLAGLLGVSLFVFGLADWHLDIIFFGKVKWDETVDEITIGGITVKVILYIVFIGFLAVSGYFAFVGIQNFAWSLGIGI